MPEQRDQLYEVAERLGYPNIETLKLIDIFRRVLDSRLRDHGK